MPLRSIEQTSKTLLLEKFCSSEETDDLCTMLRNENVKRGSEFRTSVEKKLEVRSYEEFVKKFMPSVWEWIEESGDPSCPVNFRYSLERPVRVPQAHEMKLDKNEFYVMVMDLYSKKGTSGVSNLDFDYSKVAELLSPEKAMENAKQLRRDLTYNYKKMLELKEGAKTERNKCIRKINNIRREIISQYKDSFTGKIKLALADTESKLAELPDKADADGDGDKNEFRLPCRASFDDNGDVRIIPIEDNSMITENEAAEPGGSELAVLIEKDFDRHGGEDRENKYIRSLIVSNYCGDSAVAVKLDREELIQKRNQYTAIYKASQEQFIRAISSAVEKILDVKVFFEQASYQGGRLPAPVIVANCRADELVEKEETARKFEYFINEMGRETGEYRIWFAIIPAIGDKDFIDNVDEEESLWNDIDLEASEDTIIKTRDGDRLVSTDALKAVLKILEKGKIMTFFNYRANERTGFECLDKEILERYRKKLESINGNEYAVFCYPNFTILPKKETAIEIGKTGGDDNESKEFMDIPGIYVDSAYVAAGLVVASQNPVYLEKKGYKVNRNNPCVRFDLEEGDNPFIMLTNMNREGKGVWASEVEDDIDADKFGFCFCGNTKFYGNKKVNNTYVYVARNMHKNKAGNYDPIYTRLTMDFVMQYLKTGNKGGNNKFDPSVINQFIKEQVGPWKREAESAAKDSHVLVNSILKNGEDIFLENEKLKIKFKVIEAEIDVDIEKEEQ